MVSEMGDFNSYYQKFSLSLAAMLLMDGKRKVLLINQRS
jgi:hypothetical protein